MQVLQAFADKMQHQAADGSIKSTTFPLQDGEEAAEMGGRWTEPVERERERERGRAKEKERGDESVGEILRGARSGLRVWQG
jgi:hypothetical protein